MICPVCLKGTAAHSLEAAWECLDLLARAAHELASRACGEMAQVALDRETRRPSPAWRYRP